MVDTCAAEFEAKTPYYYSSYDKGNELIKTDNKKILIIGAGPIRIGQGIEFDYCCVHSSLALKDQGIETILVNNNPETVSTDYDISDELFFEPLTFEDIMGIIEQVEPEGVIVQFGGQTSINLSVPLAKAGVKIFGTPYESIEDWLIPLMKQEKQLKELDSQFLFVHHMLSVEEQWKSFTV